MQKKKSSKRVTIKDVADFVGVHHSTVSRALSPEEKGKISPAVVKRVEKATKKLGYYPNIVASSLKRNRSSAIGILLPDMMNPVFPPIIRGVQDTAEASGYTVIIANTDDELDKERQALQMMKSRSIDGLLVLTARRKDPTVEECIKDRLPLVLLNRTIAGHSVNAVVIDEEYGVSALLDHLTSLHHRRIAHISGPTNTSTGFDRAKAFRNYMRANGLADDLIVKAKKYTVDEGFRAFKRLYTKDQSFTAVFAGNDLLALGCIDALAELKLRVPTDISVVGYNDMLFLERMHPPLTTVVIPKYEMGTQATKMLLELIGGESSKSLTLRMQPKMVVRKSTSAAAAR